MLAISLHAVRDELRDELVPINKKWPIKELLAACRAYPGLSNAKRITFEYVMLKGVNDSVADAKALVRLLAKIPAKINLIPFNPWPGAPFECSDWEQIEKFAEVVNRAGYASPVRTPARPRHHGGLRAAEEREREAAQRAAAGVIPAKRESRPDSDHCQSSGCPVKPGNDSFYALAQASAASRRSLPQNNSSPMVKDGAPNNPRAAASSV